MSELIKQIKKDYKLKKGTKVYCKLNHVSQSGMTRAISFYVLVDGVLSKLDYSIGKLLCYKFNNKHGGLTVRGCGMDMGFDVVYNLSYKLFNDGYSLKHEWL